MATPVTGDKDHGGSARILNLPPPTSPEEPLRLVDYSRVNPNWLLNGDFSLNSRGTGETKASDNVEVLDGWRVEGPVSSPPGSSTYFTHAAGVGMTGDYLAIPPDDDGYSKFAAIQWLPSVDVTKIGTGTVTLTVTVSGTGSYATSPVRMGLVGFPGTPGAYPGSLINRSTLIDAWRVGFSTQPSLRAGLAWIDYDSVVLSPGVNILSSTFTAAFGTYSNVAVVVLCNCPDAQSYDKFTFHGVKLELGAEATPMEVRPNHSDRAHVEGALGRGWFTGMTTFGMTFQPPPGWIRSQGTIGPLGSGADYANNNAMDLYGVLWHDFSDLYAPVTGGRGSSALADWVAGKTISVPDARGRFLAGEDGAGGLSPANRITVAGSGINSTIHGGSGGAETHHLLYTQSGVPAHQHAYVDRFHNTTTSVGGSGGSTRATGQIQNSYNVSANGVQNAAVAHNNVPPVLFLPLFVKL